MIKKINICFTFFKIFHYLFLIYIQVLVAYHFFYLNLFNSGGNEFHHVIFKKKLPFCSPLKSNFAEYAYVIHIFSVSKCKDFSQDFLACLVFEENFTLFLILAPLQFCLFHLHIFSFSFLSLFLVFYSFIICLGVFVCVYVCVHMHMCVYLDCINSIYFE